jgi:hypothetical protein
MSDVSRETMDERKVRRAYSSARQGHVKVESLFVWERIPAFPGNFSADRPRGNARFHRRRY